MSEMQNAESFEQTLERFEKLVKDMEAGGLPLESMLHQYEEGVALSRKLKGQLEKAQGRLTELTLQGETHVLDQTEFEK